MVNNTDIKQQEDSGSEGNIPLNKLKSYGKKSLSPLIELLHRYQDDITPYFEAISKGLQGGVESLSGGQAVGGTSETGESVQINPTSSEVEKIVSGWFKEAAGGLNGFRTKLSSSNPQEIIDFIEVQARKHPGFMFSASYLTGLFFGRVGRHIGRKSLQQSGSGTTLTQ